MSGPSNDNSLFDEVLADYLRRLDAGKEVDQEQFIADHPDIADSLRDYFQTAEQIEQLGEPNLNEIIALDRRSTQAEFLSTCRLWSPRASV